MTAPTWTRADLEWALYEVGGSRCGERGDVAVLAAFARAALALQPPSEAEMDAGAEGNGMWHFDEGAEWSHKRAVAALGLGEP